MKFTEVLNDLGVLPTSLAALSLLDPEVELTRIARTAEKDAQRVEMALPAVIARAMRFGVEVTFTLNEDPKTAIVYGESAEAWLKETWAIFGYVKKQAIELFKGNVSADPFEDEREMVRIYAKRWDMDPRWQEALGVGDGTPEDYPEDWKAEWLV
jgi:hypothetical protein